MQEHRAKRQLSNKRLKLLLNEHQCFQGNTATNNSTIIWKTWFLINSKNNIIIIYYGHTM
jgi:hypothetical protein